MRASPVADIDPSTAPNTAMSGRKLKKVWYDMREPYTTVHDNLSNSGQHNGTLTRFLDFMQANGNDELYVGPRRAVIMFVVIRMGSGIPGPSVTAVLDLTLRIISNGGGFDEGVVVLNDLPGLSSLPGALTLRKDIIPVVKGERRTSVRTRSFCATISRG